MPVIENHGLRVVNERTYQIVPGTRPAPVWLHDMTIETSDSQPIEINPEFSHRLEASIMAGGRRSRRSDGYNALILRTPWAGGSLGHRALSRYLHQIRAVQPGLCGRPCARTPRSRTAWSRCSRPRSTPRFTDAERSARETALLAEIEEQLKSVASLDEDRILRRFTNLVQATVRTNLWQIGENGHPRPVISFKFDARRIDDLPAPRPLYEIFVYSPRVEGIHLRFGKVAAVACAGPTGRRISAPRSWAS